MLIGSVAGLAINHSLHMRGLVDALRNPGQAARVAAAQELVQREQFADSINGEPVEARLGAVQACEDWANKDATKQIVLLTKDQDRLVRNRALLALLRIGSKSEENLQEIINGLKEGDVNLRKNCVIALQILGQKRADMLASFHTDLSPADVQTAWAARDTAVMARLIPDVVTYMKKEGNARGPGGDVLGALPDDRSASVAALLPYLQPEMTLDGKPDKNDEAVRKETAGALGKIGSPAALPALKKAMHEDTTQVRRMAIGAIALIGAPDGEEALIESLRKLDDDNEARAQAAAGLGKIASPTAIQALLVALSDYDLKLQAAAVAALAHAGKPAVAPLLLTLRSEKPALRLRGTEVFARMATPDANEGLLALLKDPDDSVRASAAKALGFPNNAAAVMALLNSLRDSNGVVAESASEALARIGAAAQPALARALEENDALAYPASQALAKQGEAGADAVIAAGDRSPAARRWAVTALGSIGGQKAVEALKRYTQSGEEETRAAAVLALKRLGIS